MGLVFGVEVNFNIFSLSNFFSGRDGVSSFEFISVLFLFWILFIFLFDVFNFLLFDFEFNLFVLYVSDIAILNFLKLPILFEAKRVKTSVFSFFIIFFSLLLISGVNLSSLAFLASNDLLGFLGLLI